MASTHAPSGHAPCPPAAPITPPIEERQQQRGDLPEPKTLAARFDESVRVADTTESPRSPFATSSSRQQGPGQPEAVLSDSDTCSTGVGCGGSGGDLTAAAAELQPSEWRRSSHDRDEPILQSNNERFCLLPVK